MTIKITSFNEVMIYGYSLAELGKVRILAEARGVKFYDLESPCEGKKTLSGRSFIPLKKEDYGIASLCKNTLVAAVVENCLREEEGLSIIPVIFCLSSTNCSQLPVERIADKNLTEEAEDGDNPKGWISHKELRRIYKLCTDTALSSIVKEIAKKTFKFMHVIVPDFGDLTFEEIPAPWEAQKETWDRVRAEKKLKNVSPRSPRERLDWRGLIADLTKDLKIPRSKEQGSSLCLIQ